jgi:hypothetical protein
MRRLLKLSFLAMIALGTVYAQGESSQTPLPPAMRDAIGRLLKGQNSGNVSSIFPNGMPATIPARGAVCSVPLVEMPIQHPEQFTMPTSQPAINDPMPNAKGPAPPCALIAQP